MSSARSWVRAARLPSQSYIFLPLLLGQALLVRQGGQMSWAVFVLVHLFGLFDQLFIVFANDVADQETDRLNQTATVFSGGSRVLVEGQLAPGQLARAAFAAAALCLASSLALGLLCARWLALPLAAIALALLWLYSLRPVRLSYRGGGELLQMVGVGGLLPLYGYYAQSGALLRFPWPLLLALLPAHLGCALATTLPDEPSDRLSHKRTAAVLLGPAAAKGLIVALDVAGLAALVIWGGIGRPLPWWLALPAAATLAQLPLVRARPGETRLSLLVGLAVFVTLSLVGGMTAASLWGKGAP